MLYNHFHDWPRINRPVLSITLLSSFLLTSLVPLLPSPVYAAATSITPTADTTVKAGYLSSNYGSSITNTSSNYSATNTQVAYLKFDLGTLTVGQVGSVSLKLTPSLSRAIKKQVKYVASNSWTESGLNWSNKPAASTVLGTVELDAVAVAVGQALTIPLDLTSVPTTARYLTLAVENVSTPTSTFAFNSREAAVGRPQLVFTATATTPSPTSTPQPSTTPLPTTSPTPTPSTTTGIGPISITYRQGGVWLTPVEIQNIPTNNVSWSSLVSYANLPMNLVGEITCTSGGSPCSTDTKTPQAMYARAVVGLRTGNATMINQLKSELDRVEAAVNKAIDTDHILDVKWPERNLAYIAVSANLIDYRPDSLKRALRRALYDQVFDEGHTIQYHGLNQLPNKPAHGRWSLMASAYLLEDWATVNAAVKAHAKAMGEEKWGGVTNDHQFNLTSMGDDDNWQTLQPDGKSDPLAIMPSGIYYQDHGVGGLFLADQYRAANGPQWAPVFTDYIFEGMSSYNALSTAADHLGYKNVFSLGDYALLRAMLFAYSNHDGKTSWSATGNDAWQLAALMTWAKTKIGSTLPDRLKPEPSANVAWPLPVTASGTPGRSMGFMYATHYARLNQ